MGKWLSRKSTILALAATLLATVVGFALFGQSVKWVGTRNIEIHIAVVDAETAQPIPNATIYFHSSEGGFCRDSSPPEVTITVDTSGHALRIAEDCSCFGSRSAFENTFASHLPRWCYQATASGYLESDLEDLEVPQNINGTRLNGSVATLSISIPLRRNMD